MSISARFNITRGSFSLNVDLALPASGVSAVFGPSGSGKTTLLRAIAGLDRHPGGRLAVAGSVWQDEGFFMPPQARRLGYVFQEASLFPHLTVRGNLEYGLKRIPQSERQIALNDIVDLLALGGLLTRSPAMLSGGERQRVAIGRALAVSPRLLLMDEPLSSLDRKLKLEILPYLETLHRELDIPVLYVSHDTDEVARLADHLVILKQGRILGSGPVGEMLTRLDLPLAHRRDAETLIPAVVVETDLEYGLAVLAAHTACKDTHLPQRDTHFTEAHKAHKDTHSRVCEDTRFTVVSSELRQGQRVRLRIAAHDVSITLARQEGTSILNIFPATVDELLEEGSAQVMIKLKVADFPVLARLTRKSAAVLELHPGKPVYVQMKSVAVLA